MPIKSMEEEAEATREAGMTKHTTGSTGRTRVAKRGIQRPIAQRQKRIIKNMTRAQRPPFIERP